MLRAAGPRAGARSAGHWAPEMTAERHRGALGRVAPTVTFAALAGFAAAHWSALVAGPPALRTLLAVLIATAGGAALAAVRPAPGRPLRTGAIRSAMVLATAAAGMLAMGVPVSLLWPGGFAELADGIARGLTGVRTLEWPYDGPDAWVRLTVLLAIPVTLAAAAALTFWPARRGALPLRAGGLGVLLALYGVAVAQHDVGAPLVQGAMLLALLAAWLFLPRIRREGALLAGAMLLVALGAAVPLAAGVAAEEPVVDYRSWRWLGDPTTYDWNHGYGPIDWPRRGETVLTVESRRPHYWKAVALDRFDGLRWVRSETAASAAPDPAVPGDAPERWEAEAKVTVGAVDTTLLVTPGSVRAVDGPSPATLTRDGGARVEEELEQGAIYSVDAYAPNPTADRMRSAPDPSTFAVRPYTLIHLPSAGRTNLDVVAAGEDEQSLPGAALNAPRYSDGLGGTPSAEDALLDSAYARVYLLARRLAQGAPTTYDVVRRVEAHLRDGFRYSERPPDSEYPLAAFLFEDREGYCQQFSGAMALMLRMNGIPARVAAGFAPGSRASNGNEFTVRDFDAHSWVEVYFAGIGWVPFDPTPPDAPAASTADGSLASAARGGDTGAGLALAEALAADGAESNDALGRPAADVIGSEGGSGAGGRARTSVAALVAATLIGGGGLIVAARRRRLRGPDASVRELARALERLGHPVAPGTTLVDLERRLAEMGRPAAARYVRRVREHRFAARRRPSEPGARRALRSALTAGSGPLRRARGYVALPPRGRERRPV